MILRDCYEFSIYSEISLPYRSIMSGYFSIDSIKKNNKMPADIILLCRKMKSAKTTIADSAKKLNNVGNSKKPCEAGKS